MTNRVRLITQTLFCALIVGGIVVPSIRSKRITRPAYGLIGSVPMLDTNTLAKAGETLKPLVKDTLHFTGDTIFILAKRAGK